MVQRNIVISGCVIFLIIVSLFFLVRVALNEAPYLMFTTVPRLNAFLAVHIIIIGMMVWFTMLTQFYQHVRWGFFLSFSIAFTITCVEIYVAVLRSKPANKQLNVKTV